MARLFLAVWPPDDVVEALRSLPRKDQRGVRFVPPHQWHVTLRFLGEANVDDVITALDDAANARTLPTAHAQLGPGVDVLFDRLLIVPVRGLDELAGVITSRTARLGEPPRKRFVGHLTLARCKPHAEMPRAMGAFVQERFTVDEFALVESRLDSSGPRYETLESWPLSSDLAPEDSDLFRRQRDVTA